MFYLNLALVTALMAAVCVIGGNLIQRLKREYRIMLFVLVGVPVLVYEMWLVVESAFRH